MAPQSPSATTDMNSNDETVTGEEMSSMNNSSLQEENQRLREKLAATEEQLRVLALEKENSQNNNTDSPPTRRTKKWNYRNWINNNGSRGDHHELVPQEEEEDSDAHSVASIDVEPPAEKAEGLHRRHVESPKSPPRRVVDSEVITNAALCKPFELKAKNSDAGLSDIEEGGGPHSPKSHATDESFLNEHHSLDDNDCTVAVVRTSNIEDESFLKNMYERSGWLVGLLILQSCSSFILSNNQELLQAHIVLVQFLTMLVGAGGNCGNQASVRVIRGLAVGSLRSDNVKPFLWSEFRMAICLSLILGVVGCIRAAIFMVPLAETVAITASLLMIVMISIVIGATLPLLMHYVKIDPAHSSTTIQVLMDILGVTITCLVSGALLNSPLGAWLSPGLYDAASDATDAADSV